MKYNIPLPRVLDANGNELRRLNLIDASVSLSLVPLSTAQITLPLFENLNMREWVEMYTSQGSVGVFRVRSPGQNYRMESKQYTLDHGIVELSDHVIKTEVEFNTAANSVITAIFSHYDGSMWRLGTVLPTQTVEYSGDHEDILTALLYVMEQLPDYMMQFDQTTKPWTLNIVSRPQTVTGEGRLSRNVISARISEDDSSLCTRILSPSLPDGKLDADTIGIYGVVERFFGKDDEQPQEEFIANCNKYLEQHKRPLLSVNLELCDLEQITGEALDNITVGDLYRLALPEYNTTIEQPVISLSWRSVYGDPGTVNVTLAHEEMTMSSAFSAVAGAWAGSLDGSSSLSKANQKIIKQEVKLRKTSERVENAYDILDEAFIEIETQGVTIGKQTQTIDLLSGRVTEAEASISVQSDQIQSKVSREEFNALGEEIESLGTSITETAESIRSEAWASQSQIYSTIEQTASSITAKVDDTENGLYSVIQQTASGIRQTISATTNRTWVQDNDPRSAAGGSHEAKPGDIWIESTHQGTWDGAEGYDWEHDEGYDWSQIMGARIWTFQNGKWELASDKQQVISYTDLVNTAENLISRKIAGIVNDEGLLDVYLSKLEQTATEIKGEVYSATSDIYSYIHQTASGISIGIDSSIQKVYTQDSVKDGMPIYIGEDGIPRDADGRPLKDGDIWIDTANQETWDKALNWNWEDDAVYDWNELRDSVIYRYDSGSKTFEPVTDGRIYTDQLDLDIADDHIRANMRSIDLVQGEVRENAHQFSVTTSEMRSTFNDRIRQMGSEVQQTTDQLRSDYYAANSKIYSEIRQTASALTSKFANDLDDVGSQITQTASEIRSEVHASQSQVYSEIKQTASQISLKVGKGDVATQLAVEMGNVTVSNGNLVVGGYITSAGLKTAVGAIDVLDVKGLRSFGNIIANRNLVAQGDILFQSGEDTTSVGNAIASFGTATESGGRITIPTTKLSGAAGPDINFNIADTKTYKDAVSAVTLKTQNGLVAGSGTYYPSQNGVIATITANLTNNKSPSRSVLIPVSGIPSSPSVTAYYPSSFEVTNVVKTSRGYTVYADIKVKVEFSDGTSITSGAYSRSYTYYD